MSRTRDLRARGCVSRALLAAVLAVAAVSPAAASDVVIVAFGDSITYGTGGASNGPRTGYPAYLQKILSANHPGISFAMVNSGVSSETTAGGLARLDRVLERHAPRFVLIMEGTNDMSLGVPFGTVQDNLRKMVLTARARGVVPILATVIPPHPGLYASQYARTRAFYGGGYVQTLCRTYGIPCADLWREFHGVPGFGNTLLNLMSAEHPNDNGYRYVMAPAWYEALLPLLGLPLPFVSRDAAISLSVSTRTVSRGSRLELGYALAPSNDVVKNAADCYLALRVPGGRLFFFDEALRPSARPVPLGRRLMLDRLPPSGGLLPLDVGGGFPEGDYAFLAVPVRSLRSVGDAEYHTGPVAEAGFRVVR